MKKIIALVLALALVLASGVVAFADDEPIAANANVTVTIDGIHTGDTLKLYQIAKSVYNPTTNELEWTWFGGLKETDFTFTDEGYVFAQNSAGQKKALEAYNALKSLGAKYSVDATGEEGKDGSATVDVEPGYYVAFVEGTKDSGYVYQRMLIDASQVVDNDTNSYVAHAEIPATMKKEPITIIKTEYDAAKAIAEAKTTDGYSNGEEIPFTINTSIPSYPNTAVNATFTITDTPTGLTDKLNTIVVKVDGEEVEAGTTTFSIAADTEGGKGFKITFVKDYILSNPAKPVVVTYKAVLGAPVTLLGGTTNKAIIEYNPNPSTTDTWKPDDTTEQFQYGVVVYKYKDGEKTTPLSGAKFVLYASDKETVVGEEKTTDENGYIVWRDGLKKGTYYIQETKAPTGYRLDDSFHEIILDDDNADDDDPTTAEKEEFFNIAEIPNTPGASLPETGGIGTTIFYILGGLLVVGAAVILVARRKAQD